MIDRERATPFERRVRGVILGTAAAGVVGGALGAALGALAPGFMGWLARGIGDGDDAGVAPVDMGTGLGTLSGLLIGAAGTVLLAMVESWRETRLEEARAARARDGEEEERP